MMEAVRNGAWADGKTIPYDRVKYIESSGTQYIDTGLVAKFDNAFFAEIDFEPTVVTHGGTATTNTVCICGANSGPASGFELRWQHLSETFVTVGGSYGNYMAYDKKAVDLLNVRTTAKNINGIISYSAQGIILNATPSNSGFVSGSVLLFGERRGSYVQSITLVWAKVFSASFGSNDDDTINLIPVKFVNENGEEEAALYDLNNPTGGEFGNGLYRNKGNGTFGWEDKNGVYVPPT